MEPAGSEEAMPPMLLNAIPLTPCSCMSSNGDEVSERISAGTNSVVSAYKSARLEQMAERGFSYARLDVAAVTDAFAGCMAKRRFF